MSRPSMRKRNRSERGQSLTELAIAMTVILLVLAGVLDFGRLWYTYLSLQSAAAEGAAYGSIAPTDLAGIETRVRGESPAGIVDWSDATVTTTILGQPCSGGGVKVEVDYAYTIITPFMGTFLGSQTLPLKTFVVNTVLAPACP